VRSSAVTWEAESGAPPKMRRTEYERQMRILHGELVAMQEWVKELPIPTEREKSQMYVQRYVRHFPAAGEVVIFGRCWYNRAGVERVMGFCKSRPAVWRPGSTIRGRSGSCRPWT
jgi:polyphosphate kinase 2 (PPK2 family)